jgi:DNA polymerase-3 subunit delta
MAAALSFDSAYRQIRRGELAPVYYLTGEEDVLKDELVSQVVEHAVDPASRDFNLDVRSAGDLDGESLHALVETPPMLAERRVVVVKNLEQWRKNAKVWQVLDRYLANPSPTTVLVLVHGAGQKPQSSVARHAAQVAVEALNPERLRRWVKMRAERAELVLEPEAVGHLVDALGGDLSHLAMEIEKLAAAADGDRPLGITDVADLVGVRRGETAHDWVASAIFRDVPQALDMLESVLSASGVNGVRLVGLLGTALIGVRLARALMDQGLAPRRVEQAVLQQIRRARPMGLGSWRDEASRWTEAAHRWSAPELDRALRAAWEADRALKSTTISDEAGSVTDMLLALSARKAAA